MNKTRLLVNCNNIFNILKLNYVYRYVIKCLGITPLCIRFKYQKVSILLFFLLSYIIFSHTKLIF